MAQWVESTSDVLERDGHDSTLSNGQLAVRIECGGAGYLKVGPALDVLEEEAEGWGAAFYADPHPFPVSRHTDLRPWRCTHV